MQFANRTYLVLALVGVLAIAGAAVTIASGLISGDDSGGNGPAVTSSGPSQPGAGDQVACPPTGAETQPIADAKLIFEFNSTDHDTGVHGQFDSSGWSELCVQDPTGKLVLAVKPQNQLKDLTVGGIFFESREPPNDEISQDEILARFPEGEYTVTGTTYQGKSLLGRATLTHDIPAPPAVTSPAEDEVVDPAGLVVRWDPVTQTVQGDPVEITGYEVIVTKEGAEDPNGFSQPILSAHVIPSVSSLTVPASSSSRAPNTNSRCWRLRRAATRRSACCSSRRNNIRS